MTLKIRMPQSYTIVFWLFLFVIGLITGLIAFVSGLIVSSLLYSTLNLYANLISGTDTINYSFLAYYVIFNLIFCLIAGALVIGVAPMASGSGLLVFPNSLLHLIYFRHSKYVGIFKWH